MSLRQNTIIKESLEELTFLKKQQTNYKSIQKLRLLELLKSNPKLLRKTSAKELGITTRTQERWLSIYNSQGLEVFIARQTNSKKSQKITSEIHEALASKVNSSKEALRGYWDAQLFVKETFNVDIKYATLRNYLIKHFKTKLKQPRKSHYKKDQQAVDGFLKNPSIT